MEPYLCRDVNLPVHMMSFSSFLRSAFKGYCCLGTWAVSLYSLPLTSIS